MQGVGSVPRDPRLIDLSQSAASTGNLGQHNSNMTSVSNNVSNNVSQAQYMSNFNTLPAHMTQQHQVSQHYYVLTTLISKYFLLATVANYKYQSIVQSRVPLFILHSKLVIDKIDILYFQSNILQHKPDRLLIFFYPFKLFFLCPDPSWRRSDGRSAPS